MEATPTIDSAEKASKKAVESTMLSPRFYTTDFDAMDRLDMSSVRADWDKMMAEYEGDNNHDHFQRDAQFADEVAQRFSQVSPRNAAGVFGLPDLFADFGVFWLHLVQRNF